MREYWLTFANTDYDCKRLNVERLEYPLIMYVPTIAFTFEQVLHVSRKSKRFQLGVELAVKLSQDIFHQREGDASRAIGSYSILISAVNDYHIRNIKSRVVESSDQDQADSEYFTRWWEKSNALSGGIDCDWDTLCGREIGLSLGNFSITTKFNYFHTPASIVHFLSGFTRLYEHTYIGLGNIMRQVLDTSQADGMIVRCELGSLADHEVKLCLTD